MSVKGEAVAKSLFWQFLERFGAEIVTFVVSIILARLLDPVVYGTIALVTVFTTIMNVFVDSGFCSALIQKKNPDYIDYSTVFYFNLFIAVILYAAFFFLAIPIANFYNNSELVWIIRILSLSVLFSAFKNCSKAYISKHMQFKKYFFATLGGTIAAAVVGITMAIKGFGVWALVMQFLVNSFVDAIVLFFSVEWKPKLVFSFSRLKSLFSFGWKLLLSSLTETICDSLRSFIIGKKYSSEDLAYYNKGYSFPSILGTNVTASLLAVLFPTFSSIQDNPKKVKETIRSSIKLSSYLVFPIMIGLAVVAEPLISLLLTDKWLPCVPYLRMFCIFFALKCVDSTTGSVLKGTGKSGVLSILQITKRIIDLTLILSLMWFGVIYVAASFVIYGIVSYILNMFVLKKYFNYTLKEQLIDLIPNVLISLLMGVFTICFQSITQIQIITLIIQILVGASFYVIFSAITKNESFVFILSFVRMKLKSRKKNEFKENQN